MRSAVGLPLAWAEARTSEAETWRAGQTRDRAVCFEAIELPVHVRAPGHLQLEVDRPGEVTLEPDLLLTVEIPEARTAIRSAEVFTGYGDGESMQELRMRAACMGVTDPDLWRVAVSADVAARLLPSSFGARMELADRRRVFLTVALQPGLRARTRLDAVVPVASSPLEVAIQRQEGDPRAEVQVDLATRSLPTLGSTRVYREDPPWGRVVVQEPYTSVESTLEPDADEVSFDDVVVGQRYVLTARDLRSGAFDRLFFQHDGTTRGLVLAGGLRVVGRLAGPAGSPPPHAADLAWDLDDGPATEGDRSRWASWHGELRGVELGPEGQFRIVVPSKVPVHADMEARLPSRLTLRLEVAGFESAEVVIPTTDRSTWDCGGIDLTLLAPQVLLAPGHGLDPGDLAWQGLGVVLADGRPACFEIRSGRLRSDGSLAVCFQRSREDASGFRGWRPDEGRAPLTWPDVLPGEIVVGCGSDSARAFRLGGEGRYVRVEMRRYSLHVVLGPLEQEAGPQEVGWLWSGIPSSVYSKPSAHSGLEIDREFDAPAGDVLLWWRKGHGPMHDLGPLGTIRRVEVP